MSTEPLRDFFISYNRHDQTWAEWIAWQVEAHGYSVIIQAWDFRPGSNFVLEMQSGLSEAQRLLLILSSNFLHSDFTQPEWAAVFASDPRSSEQKLVPVRVGECEPTGLLKTLVYIDLVGKDEKQARTDLLAGLIRGRAKPSSAPKFPDQPAPAYPSQTAASAHAWGMDHRVDNAISGPVVLQTRFPRLQRKLLLACGLVFLGALAFFAMIFVRHSNSIVTDTSSSSIQMDTAKDLKLTDLVASFAEANNVTIVFTAACDSSLKDTLIGKNLYKGKNIQDFLDHLREGAKGSVEPAYHTEKMGTRYEINCP